MKRWMIAICALMLCVGCLALSNEQEAVSPAPSESEKPQINAASSSKPSAASLPEQQNSITADPPVLVTSFGQGTDSILVREMLVDLEMEFDFLPMAQPEDISKYNTVILALGASSKALASNGISPDLEYERCAKIVEALSGGCTVILVRLSDIQNQDPVTEKLIPLALPHSDIILAIENGLNSTILQFAKQNSIPLRSCEKIKDMTYLFRELLNPS